MSKKQGYFQTPNEVSKALFCDHCHNPYLPENPRIPTSVIQIRSQRNLCPRCARRNIILFTKVSSCIRLYGGMASMHDIMDLYNNKERYTRIHFDPFEDARSLFYGKDALNMNDIFWWVKEGLIMKSKSNKLTVAAIEARKNIEKKLHEAMQEEKAKKHAKEKTKSNKNNQVEQSLSRMREEGGASTGFHRWKNLKRES